MLYENALYKSTTYVLTLTSVAAQLYGTYSVSALLFGDAMFKSPDSSPSRACEYDPCPFHCHVMTPDKLFTHTRLCSKQYNLVLAGGFTVVLAKSNGSVPGFMTKVTCGLAFC